ncbi:MAG: putative inorganic carbon transporter subunit DabA, partial [Halobacteria archaeon]|nr:putative inorganic carbon transporter subunit DabA [Halobacteria archaeon]
GEYDTYGYAGFFGVPMTYDPEDTETTVDACPPIVDPAHRIEEETNGDGSEEARRLLRWSSLKEAGDDLVEILETNVATAYNYVELSGGAYGA